MAFEEQLPQWENEGTQPPQSKRVEGWLPNEKPPASWFNWLFGRTYRVLKEFQEKAAEKVDIDDYKNEIRSLGLGIDVDPRLSSDLNQEINTGWVTTNSDTLNRPPASHGVVRIERRAATRVVQTFYSLGDSADVKIYTRASGGSLGDVWSDWVEVLHTGNTGSIVTEDYEVGTWTPEYITDGNPIEEIEYSPISSGGYVRVGGLVYIRLNIGTARLVKGSASGALRITGLPFPYSPGGSLRFAGLSIARAVGFSSDANERYPYWRATIIPNSAEIAILENDPDALAREIEVSTLRDHTSSSYNYIAISGSYYTTAV